jgi:MinD superfamily P-loop ATPase
LKQITILSGKGGTGKTTITAAFTVLAKKAVVADCDVDAQTFTCFCIQKLSKQKSLGVQK